MGCLDSCPPGCTAGVSASACRATCPAHRNSARLAAQAATQNRIENWSGPQEGTEQIVHWLDNMLHQAPPAFLQITRSTCSLANCTAVQDTARKQRAAHLAAQVPTWLVPNNTKSRFIEIRIRYPFPCPVCLRQETTIEKIERRSRWRTQVSLNRCIYHTSISISGPISQRLVTVIN